MVGDLELISTQVVVDVEVGWGLDFTKLILNLTEIEDVVEVRYELGKKFVRKNFYLFWQFKFFRFN